MATFTKAERLCTRDDINALLGAGKWVNAGVLKVCWAVSGAAGAEAGAGACEGVAAGAAAGARAEGAGAEAGARAAGAGARAEGVAEACEGVAARAEGVAEGGCRIMISVPKRNFKRAVARNLLKRRIREAYRLDKEAFTGLGLDMLICYKSRDIHPFADIQRDLRAAREAIASACGKAGAAAKAGAETGASCEKSAGVCEKAESGASCEKEL